MAAIHPTDAQIARLLGDAEKDGGPVVMVNLLRFYPKARYPDGTPDADVSGQTAYNRYGMVTMQTVPEVGGRFLFTGRASAILIGPEDEQWDMVALLEYPNRQAFVTMINLPHYQAATIHRDAGLADTRIWPVKQNFRLTEA